MCVGADVDSWRVSGRRTERFALPISASEFEARVRTILNRDGAWDNATISSDGSGMSLTWTPHTDSHGVPNVGNRPDWL